MRHDNAPQRQRAYGFHHCAAEAMTSEPLNASPTRSGTPAGIGLMLLGIFLFCCNDAL